MSKKRFRIKDTGGNVVDYDIEAGNVTLDSESKSLTEKLGEIDEALENAGSGSVSSVSMNDGTPIEPDANGNIDLGTVITEHQDISGKQDTISDLDTIRTGAALGATAIQEHQDISGKANSADLADVATSGSYNDLSDTPTFPEGVTVKQTVTEGDTDAVSGGAVKDYVDEAVTDVVVGTVSAAVVDNLVTDSSTDALSAGMGKHLKDIAGIQAGTYAQAWVKSQVVAGVFPWLWSETVSGTTILKPIWHVGNGVFVDAAGATISVDMAAAGTPTFSLTSGSTVAKNTQLTITPAANNVLYYSTDNVNWTASASAVTITLSSAGSVTYYAYCATSAGNGTASSVSLTVQGTAVPTIVAASGSTLSNVDTTNHTATINRGGSVVITGDKDGTLNYSVDGVAQAPVVGDGTNAPTATVQITNANSATTIVATNTISGDTSGQTTLSISMAALAKPTLSQADNYEFPVGGGQLTITQADGATIYYTTDGTTPDDTNTEYTGAIEITEGVTINAIAKDAYGYSDVTTATYTVAIDHKFVFKIALTGDNSTEYIPVTSNNNPKYTMTVDWGDGSDVESYTNQAFSNKGLSHAYSGSAGDEFTITLRGSAIPSLSFGNETLNNRAALVTIEENSLTCDTSFYLALCTSLRSLSADAMSNNIATSFTLESTAVTTIPDGLISNWSKSTITSCYAALNNASVVFTASQMEELKSIIGSVTNFTSMFYGFKGTAAIPDDFFDGVTDGTITNVKNFTHTAKSGLTGDAYALYTTLLNKITGTAYNAYVFTATSLSNRSQVPTTWGGTAS